MNIPDNSQELSPIYGFLKRPSMIDFPGRLSGVMFTSGCNFQCAFCHNSTLLGKPRPGLSWNKLGKACHQFRRQWVDGIVISGGEPTLPDNRLAPLISFFKQFGFAVKLDTNGSLPEKLTAVLPLLDYLAVDVKCSQKKYPLLTGFNHPEKIIDTVKLVRQSGIDYEFRTTVIETIHDLDEITAIASLIAPADRYIIQPFIPRSDLPDPNMRELTRTSPDYMRQVKEMLVKSGCAKEIIIR